MARFNIISNSSTVDASEYVTITRNTRLHQSSIIIDENAPADVTVYCSDEEGGEVVYTAENLEPGSTKRVNMLLYLVRATMQGGGVIYSGKPKYNGLFGKPSYLEFAEIASPSPIPFQIGNYVDYPRTGIRYKLYREPLVEKSARKNTCGDAFVYKNVQFFAPTKDLELALFRDLVMNDNLIHFSSIPNVDTYEDVAGIARRIQANMDAFAGSGVWDIVVYEDEDEEYNALISEVKQFSLSDGTCLDALNKIYELWKGIGWVYSEVGGKHTVTIGRPNIQDGDNTTDVFRYGINNGLKVIAKSDSSNAEIATRVYAYGSERNLPARYYNNLRPVIKDYDSVYIPHLMLPLDDWRLTDGLKDARLAYLESEQSIINRLGVIPKILRFDGTGDLEEIYPSIEGMTIGQAIEGTEYTSQGYSTSERVDELKGAVNPLDNGLYTNDGSGTDSGMGSKILETHQCVVTPSERGEVVAEVIPGQTQLFWNCGQVAYTEEECSPGRFIFTSDIQGTIDGEASGSEAGLPALLKSGTEPRVKVNVEVGGIVRYSKYAKLTLLNDVYSFSLDRISFTSENGGILRVYITLEAEFNRQDAEDVYVYYTIDGYNANLNVEYAISSTFKVTLKQIGFDISTMGSALSDGYATLAMKTGKCAGRQFVIKGVEYDTAHNQWILTCQRQEDSSIGQWFPNSVYELEAGDRFVLLDLQMPENYVTAAMDRLHDAAARALARLEKPKKVYTPTIDSKAVMLSEIALLEGMYMPVQDNDLIGDMITEYILIDSLTIAENDDAIPIYSVTLRDEKPESMLQKIKGEITNGNKFIDGIIQGDTRGPAPDDDGEAVVPVAPSVSISAPADFILPSQDGVVLTAVPSGIVNPFYQWQYKHNGAWVDITDATEQAYKVLASSSLYFPSGDIVAELRVLCRDGEESLVDYNADIAVTKVQSLDGLTVALSDSSHVFAADSSHALTSSFNITVIAKRGGADIATRITDFGGWEDDEPASLPTGLTIARGIDTGYHVGNYVVVSSATTLVEPQGTIWIQFQVQGMDGYFNLKLSWALSLKGNDGDPGTPGTPGTPGDDGYSNATIYLYQRFPTGTPSGTRVGSTTYTFATDTLAGTLNGWSRTVPSGNGPVYVTFARVSSNQASVSIPAGWVSDSPAGGWSLPARMTGQDGQVGKIMRGVNRWTSTFEPEGGWQGMNDVDGLFYDVVVYSVYDSVQEKYVDKYFYLTDGAYGDTTPGSAAAEGYWIEAVNFDFIATKVLLADNAFIDVLSGNAIYMYDNDGSAGGQKVAGIQGGSIDLYGNPVINFFAGTDASTVIADAPFRVYSDGSLVASKGMIGPYEIGEDGLSRQRNVRQGDTILTQRANYSMTEAVVSSVSGGITYRSSVTPAQIEVYRSGQTIYSGTTTITPTLISVESALGAQGDIKRDGESVVTSESSKHIWIGSYLDYISLTKSNDTMYIINSGDTNYMGIYVGSTKVASL